MPRHTCFYLYGIVWHLGSSENPDYRECRCLLACDVSQPQRSLSRLLNQAAAARCLAWPHLPVEDAFTSPPAPCPAIISCQDTKEGEVKQLSVHDTAGGPWTPSSGGCHPRSGGVTRDGAGPGRPCSPGAWRCLLCARHGLIIFLGNLPDRRVYVSQAFHISQPQMKVTSSSSRGPCHVAPPLQVESFLAFGL